MACNDDEDLSSYLPSPCTPIPETEDIFEGGHKSLTDYLSTTYEDPASESINFTLQAYDGDDEPLSYSCYSGCPDGLNVDLATGEVTWIPPYNLLQQEKHSFH